VTVQSEPPLDNTKGEQIMQARMKNPGIVLPDAMPAIQSLIKAISKGGAPKKTLELVHLRASQINGCSVCVYGGVASAKKAGETDERLSVVAAWREAPFFTEAERAALALAEAATRLSDRGDQVPDEIWEAAAAHYNEQELAAIVLTIATTNFFNRINLTIKEPAGATWS
jgi:AhpD family alkylhydroperoxidase